MAAPLQTATQPKRSETPEQRYLRHIRTAAIIVAAATVIACALAAVLLITVRTQDNRMEGQISHVNSNLTHLRTQGG